MFRRKEEGLKEEGLFDTATNTNEVQESAKVISQPASSSSAYTANAPTAAAHATPTAQHAPSSSGNSNSQQPAARPAPAQANSFRSNPAAPINSDLTRNRMPEAKSSMSSALANPVAASAPTNNAPEKAKSSGRRVLTVGNDILLKGEIATCDRLVIEGKVDASLNDVHTVEIAETGSFKGSANIEDAEISGLFEGDLVVRNRLVIYATGKVRGKITYGEIEIERGGELTGEIKTSTAVQTPMGQRAPRAAAVKADDKVAA